MDEYRGGTVTNIAGGTITGDTAQGVYLGGAGTVTNSGSIIGGTYGVDLTNTGTVTNLKRRQHRRWERCAASSSMARYGDWRSGANVLVYNAGTLSGSTGVFEFAGGSVTNVGTIIGHSDPGIVLGGPGTVVNSGAVSECLLAGQRYPTPGFGYGVYLSESGSVNNLAGGTISGYGGVYISCFSRRSRHIHQCRDGDRHRHRTPTQ